jgi:hypothetical protein
MKLDFFASSFNTYKPLTEALGKLKDIVGNDTYMEAFRIGKNDLHEITEIVFWLCRCDPALNGIIFFDEMERYYFNICQYWNVHFTMLGENKMTNEALAENGFRIIGEGDEACFEWPSE